MKNPNGYGSVYKLSGRRRRPWAARVTLGFKPENGQPIYKFVCYCKTRAEAMKALALYNGEVVEDNKVTLETVYNEWAIEHSAQMKRFVQYSSAFKAFTPLYNKPIANLQIRDFEEVGNKSGKSKGVLNKAKIALSGVYAYAYRKGYIDESKASMPKFIKFVDAVVTEAKHQHVSFTHEEVAKLWEHTEEYNVRIILFMIYTGLRISELANLKCENVHLDEQYFDVIASKTEAGIRKVPIADKILPFAREMMAEGGTYLTRINSKKSATDYYRSTEFVPTCKRILGVEHMPHDTRHTCATFLAEKCADDRHIHVILGHAQKDVTNSVYAKKLGIDALLNTINLL